MGNHLVRGISGGERKRLNIGTELVTDPSLIFLDEPTSGLDSFNAQSVMQMLLKLAKNSRTVVTTIHQPRSSIFQMFDSLMLLSEGRCIYFGSARASVEYFSGQGFRCPHNFNPSDYFMDLLSVDNRSQKLERLTKLRVSLLADAFEKHLKTQRVPSLRESTVLKRNGSSAYAAPGTGASHLEGNTVVGAGAKYATSWLYQFGQLSVRSLRSRSVYCHLSVSLSRSLALYLYLSIHLSI